MHLLVFNKILFKKHFHYRILINLALALYLCLLSIELFIYAM